MAPKQSKKKDHPTSSSSSPGDESQRGKRKAVAKRPKSQAEGKGKGAAGSSQAEQIEYDDDINLSHVEREVLAVHPPRRSYRDRPVRNFQKGDSDMKTLRFNEGDAPHNVKYKDFKGDSRFWLTHQADWYVSVIMSKDHITTPMKWVDWEFLRAMTSPVKEVMDAIYDRCVELDLVDIMEFKCNWNEEVVAQFYATLWIDDENHIMHWSLEGKRFQVSIVQFGRLFGFNLCDEDGNYRQDTSKIDLHGGSPLEDSKMHFMYDPAYDSHGRCQFGKAHGLSPYYKMFNQLFRGTLTPRGGNSDNISHRAKDLLAQTAPGMPKFLVFEFIWNEIIHCSHNASNACHYAPYIQHMINTVTGLRIRPDIQHVSYQSPRGKIEQLLKIGSKQLNHCQPRGPLPGNYPQRGLPRVMTTPRGGGSGGEGSSRAAPPPRSAPSSSRGPSFPTGGKKGKLDMILQGVFACFGACKRNAEAIERHEKYVNEKLYKIEKRQKDQFDRDGIPHSPLSDPMDFPPPPPLYDPWGGFSGYTFGPGGDDIEEEDQDLGGCERGARDEEATESDDDDE